MDSGYEIEGYDLIDRKILEDKIYAGIDYYHLELDIQTWEV